jgi:hypothetical protein
VRRTGRLPWPEHHLYFAKPCSRRLRQPSSLVAASCASPESFVSAKTSGDGTAPTMLLFGPLQASAPDGQDLGYWSATLDGADSVPSLPAHAEVMLGAQANDDDGGAKALACMHICPDACATSTTMRR